MNRPRRATAQSSIKDDEIVDTDDEDEQISSQTKGKPKKVESCSL
jgi:hypothetical protein